MSRFALPRLPLSLRPWGLVALACSAVALSGCGGGSRAKAYQPAAVVSFGDEYSAISDPVAVSAGAGGTVQGLTYSVNSVALSINGFCTDQSDTACASYMDASTNLDASTFVINTTGYFMFSPGNVNNVVTRLDKGTASYGAGTPAVGPIKRESTYSYLCNATTIWSQVVSRGLGFGYRDKCSTDLAGAITYAAPGAKVAQVAGQVSAHIGELNRNTLVTVWAGQNDIVDILGTISDQGLRVAEAQARALVLADVIKQVLNTGAKVLVVNVPNLGYSPYGVAQTPTKACTNATLNCNGNVEEVVKAFNRTLLEVGLRDYANDGRQLGHVDAEVLTTQYALNGSYNTTAGVCNTDTATLNPMRQPDGTVNTTDLRYCNSQTLVSGANSVVYLWLDDKHVAPVLHSAVGSLAFSRAANQF